MWRERSLNATGFDHRAAMNYDVYITVPIPATVPKVGGVDPETLAEEDHMAGR